MIRIELHTGEILTAKGISSDPMNDTNCIIQQPKKLTIISWNQIKHISAC